VTEEPAAAVVDVKKPKTTQAIASSLTVERLQSLIQNAKQTFPQAQDLQVRQVAEKLDSEFQQVNWKSTNAPEEPVSFLDQSVRKELTSWIQSLPSQANTASFSQAVKTIYNEVGDEKKAGGSIGNKIILQTIASSHPEAVVNSFGPLYKNFNVSGAALSNTLWILRQMDARNEHHAIQRFKVITSTLLDSVLNKTLKGKDERTLFELIGESLGSLKLKKLVALVDPTTFISLQKEHLTASAGYRADQLKDIYNKVVNYSVKAAPAEYFSKLLQSLKAYQQQEQVREHVLDQLQEAIVSDCSQCCQQWSKSLDSALVGTTLLLQRFNQDSSSLRGIKSKDVLVLRETVEGLKASLAKRKPTVEDKKQDKDNWYKKCIAQVDEFLNKEVSASSEEGGFVVGSVLLTTVTVIVALGVVGVGLVKVGCQDGSFGPYLSDSNKQQLAEICSKVPEGVYKLFQ